MKKKSKKKRVIADYDEFDTTSMIDSDKALRFADIGLKLPDTPPTQVISIRLPTALLNEIKALGSRDDVPYQALIKLFLAEAVQHKKSKPTRLA
jgi:predicted DNA binding CopG/RHH family protein